MDKGTKTQRLYGRDGKKLSAGLLRCRIQDDALIELGTPAIEEWVSRFGR